MTADRLALDRVPFYGRTLGEGLRYFGLSLGDLVGRRVLDCGAGASSLAAEAALVGARVVACDPLLALPAEALAARAAEDADRVARALEEAKGLYRWDEFGDAADVRRARTAAAGIFLADLPNGRRRGRYAAAALPRLPFRSGAFDLALCGHLLFTFADLLDDSFHVAALLELVRVARGEARIYPLQGLDARPHPRMGAILAALADRGVGAEILEVPYEFQRGSDRMLRLIPGG